MQVCTPSQTTMPSSHHSVFYRPDALPDAQPTASKHWRQILPSTQQYQNTEGMYVRCVLINGTYLGMREKAEVGRCCQLASCGIISSVHRLRLELRTCSTKTRAIARATNRILEPSPAATCALKSSNIVMSMRSVEFWEMYIFFDNQVAFPDLNIRHHHVRSFNNKFDSLQTKIYVYMEKACIKVRRGED